MKQKSFFLSVAAAGVLLTVSVAWLGAQAAATRKPLAELMPSNALLYIEAKNLGAMLQDWNASPEKKTWTGSASYQTFTRSKLALRLEEIQKAYADGFGVNPNVALLENIAGGESAVAVYDIGKLELLYVTRLPATRLADNLLLQAKTKFQTRNAAGQAYYAKSTSDGTIAFAVVPGSDLLIAGTREDLVAGALQLLSTAARPSMRSERWYSEAVAKAGSAQASPDLRMVVNLERTVKTPHFRSYWIQQNITDLKKYFASLTDLQMAQGAWTERRLLLRAEVGSPVDEAGVAALAKLTPPEAGFYQVLANPTRAAVEASLQDQFALGGAGSGGVSPESERAPGASLYELAGSEEDLDQRIDTEEAALQQSHKGLHPALAKLSEGVVAISKVGGAKLAADGVYVGIDSAVALLRSSDWDAKSVQAAVQASAEEGWSAGGALQWTRRTPTVAELSGLQPVQVWVEGKTLVIANSAALLDRMLAARGSAPGSAGAYLAGYRHASENANYARMMRLIDAPQVPTGEARAPMLFSENIAALGRVLSRVDAVSMESKDNGAEVRQVLVYRRKP